MKTRKERIHVKDQYCAGPQCDCGYKSTEPRHTQTPWIYGEENDEQFSNIRDGKSGHRIAQVMGEANAAFIVRAVNSHEEMLKALQEARQWIADNSLEEGLLGRIGKAISKAEGE